MHTYCTRNHFDSLWHDCMCVHAKATDYYNIYKLYSLCHLPFEPPILLYYSSVPFCALENVFNFTASSTLVTNQSAACLACLFNGVEPEPGTVWLLNGQNTASQFGQVNDNGTYLIMRPPGFTGQVIVTCLRGGNVFNITLIGELYTTSHYGWLMSYCFYHFLQTTLIHS